MLGLGQRFTVLLTAGGAGLGQGVLAAARHLAGSDLDVQLILNAGDNKALLARFHDIALHRPRLVRGSSDDFDVLLAACDLVIGKAGWFTLNEAIFSGRPTLIVDVVRGQEESNARAAEELGVARRVQPDEIVAWVRRYANAPDRLRTDFAVDGPAEFVAGWPVRLARGLSGLVTIADPPDQSQIVDRKFGAGRSDHDRGRSRSSGLFGWVIAETYQVPSLSWLSQRSLVRGVVY